MDWWMLFWPRHFVAALLSSAPLLPAALLLLNTVWCAAYDVIDVPGAVGRRNASLSVVMPHCMNGWRRLCAYPSFGRCTRRPLLWPMTAILHWRCKWLLMRSSKTSQNFLLKTDFKKVVRLHRVDTIHFIKFKNATFHFPWSKWCKMQFHLA